MLFVNIAKFMSQYFLGPNEHLAASLERYKAAVSVAQKSHTQLALGKFGLPIDSETGLPVVMSQRVFINLTILGMHEQLKDSPPAHAACLSTELIAKARECEVTMQEYNALLDRLAKKARRSDSVVPLKDAK